MRYHSLGRIPAKRHVQFRDTEASGNGNAPLLVEEVMGFEGFSGLESIEPAHDVLRGESESAGLLERAAGVRNAEQHRSSRKPFDR